MIDADLQYDTSILPRAVAHFRTQKLDMLNIAREVVDSSVHRRGHSLGNALFSAIVARLFGKNCKDLLSGYRIFSRAFVKSFPAHSRGFEIETELTIFAFEQKMRIDEISAPYKSRPQGSFSKLHTFRDGFKILLMIAKMLFSEKSLLVFSAFSAVFFTLGLILGVPIVLDFLSSGKVAKFPTLFVCVGFEVIAVVLFIAGLLAHLITQSTREARHLAYLSYR